MADMVLFYCLDVEKFFLQNRYLSQFSGQRRNLKTRKRKYLYRQIYETSSSLQTFYVDLIVNSKNFSHKSVNTYTLIAIDIVSRFIFYVNISSKKSTEVLSAFKTLLKKIRRMKNKQLLGIKSNDFMTFIRQVKELILAY